LNANLIKSPLWEFEFILTCRLLASEEKTLYSVLRYQHRLGSSTILKSTSAYTLYINDLKMILHLKSSGITSMSYVQAINTALVFTPMDPKLWME